MKTRRSIIDSVASSIMKGIKSLRHVIVPPRCVHLTIARNIYVNDEWPHFTTDSVMKISKKFQAVNLKIIGLRYNEETSELYLPDGKIINPQLKIVDEQGNYYPLKGGSMRVRHYDVETSSMDVSLAAFTSNLPARAKFKTVMIKSDVPFTCASILWTNYDMK